MRLKRLEHAWRKLWIQLLVRLMRRAPDSRPDWGRGSHRVLFLRHDRAGDMIVSTGVMRAIARSHPGIALDVLASPANASLVRHTSYLSNVIVFDKKRLGDYLKTLLRLRRSRYDAVIDCMVTAPSVTTLLLVFASGARYRIGIANRGNDAAFNITVRDTAAVDAHMVDRIACLATAFGDELSAEDRQPVLELTPEELARANDAWGQTAADQPRILINVSAGTSDRRWPDDRYVAVMRHLLERAPDAIIRVISSPAEAPLAEGIARGGGGAAVRTPGFRDAIALVATADFVFTPDTSIAHAASAFGRPAVAMYRLGTKTRWAIQSRPAQSIEHHSSNLRDLSLDRVLPAVDDVWDATLSRRG